MIYAQNQAAFIWVKLQTDPEQISSEACCKQQILVYSLFIFHQAIPSYFAANQHHMSHFIPCYFPTIPSAELDDDHVASKLI